MEIRAKSPVVPGTDFLPTSQQGQVKGTTEALRAGEEGRERAASLQDTKPGNNPVFASLTKKNEGLEPGWLELPKKSYFCNS